MDKLKTYLEIESNNIIYFFSAKERTRMINISQVEKKAGVPKNTLLNLLSINRIISAKHIQSITDVLSNVGFERFYDWEVILKKDREE